MGKKSHEDRKSTRLVRCGDSNLCPEYRAAPCYRGKSSKSTRFGGIIYPHLGGILWAKSPMKIGRAHVSSDVVIAIYALSTVRRPAIAGNHQKVPDLGG